MSFSKPVRSSVEIEDVYDEDAFAAVASGAPRAARNPNELPTEESLASMFDNTEKHRKYNRAAMIERAQKVIQEAMATLGLQATVESTDNDDDSKSTTRKRTREADGEWTIETTDEGERMSISNAFKSSRPDESCSMADVPERVVNEDDNDMFYINDLQMKKIYATRERDRLQQQRHIHARQNVPYENETADNFSDGDRRLQQLRLLLSTFSSIRSEQQKQFHDAFTQACLPHIYGEHWEAERERVLKNFGINAIRFEAMAITPRRFGKSWAVGMFCAGLLWCVPRIRICVFSTGKRASGSLMELVLKFLSKIEGYAKRVCKKTEEQLFLAGSAMAEGTSTASQAAKDKQTDESTAKLFSFPSSVTGKCKHNKHIETQNTPSSSSSSSYPLLLLFIPRSRNKGKHCPHQHSRC